MLGAFIFGLWLVMIVVQAVGSLMSDVGDKYNSIRLDPARVPGALLWGFFGTYVACVAFLFSRIDRVPGVDPRWERAAAAVLGLAFIVLPLVALLVPMPRQLDGSLAVGDCGSWLQPSSQQTQAGVAYSYTYPGCADLLADESRWALTIAAGGIIVPVALMLYSDVKGSKPQDDPNTVA